MPDSMFDKLGDLLSEAIESGIFFEENKNPADNTVNAAEKAENKSNQFPGAEKRDTDPVKNVKSPGENCLNSDADSIKKYTKQRKKIKNSQNSQFTVYKSVQLNNQNQVRIVPANQKVIKYAHPSLEKACTYVGVLEGMTYEEAKKQYHKKLLRFHPDKNADNEIMKKITRQKTDELVKAWSTIEEWFKENQ